MCECWEKMISCFLLLITLSCVCATFVVSVTQSSYQAEENHNITLEWSFTIQPNTSNNSLYICCEQITGDNNDSKVLYHLDDGAEVPESQDEQFSGRVQCDTDALREGRVRLHVSRLRTKDSGQYQCEVLINDRSSARCRLNVTAAADQPETQRPTEGPEPKSWGRMGLYTAAGLAAVTAAALLLKLCCASSRFTKSTDKTVNCNSVV